METGLFAGRHSDAFFFEKAHDIQSLWVLPILDQDGPNSIDELIHSFLLFQVGVDIAFQIL